MTVRLQRAILAAALCSSWLNAGSFSLRVVDPHGAAVAGARVEIRGGDASKAVTSAVTDATGCVQVRLEPPAEVRVTAAGFDPLVERAEAGTGEMLTLRLRPATLHTTVDVVVRDSPSIGTDVSRVGTALEIERSGARTVFDAVEKLVPSAFVTRRGVMGYGIATGATGVVTIRGIGESPNAGILVVVDGRPDYMGLMGHPLPDFYSLSDAESVSITQGPASVLYGSNALGGAIEIIPSRPREGVQTQLTSSFGSYYTGQHRFSHGAKFARTFYNLTGGIAHTSGERPNAAFHNQDGTLALGYDLSPVWKVSLQGRYGHFNVEDPGTIQSPVSGRYARVGRGGFSLNLDNSASHTWGSTRLYSSHGRHLIWDGFRSVDSTTGLRIHQNLLLSPRLTVDGGTDLVRHGGRANNIKSGLDYGQHHLTEAAGFFRLHHAPLDRLRLNAGFRYDHSSQYGGIVAPEFGASFRLSDRYSLSTAIAKGFRNPTLRELYLFPAPNPLLRPEYLWNYQVTFQARPSAPLLLWVTGYYADLKDMIVTTGRFPTLRLLNVGRALNRGFEGNVRWQPVRRLSFSSGYAYLRSTNLSPYVPQHKLNYSLELKAGRAFVHVGGMTVARRWADTGRTRQLGEYTVATLKCTLPLGERYSVFALVDNLFDRRYEVIPGYPMPGINVMGGFDLHF